MAVRVVQASRTGRHHIHRAAKTAAHLPALVPSHHRADVHVVFVQRVHVVRPMVHRDELLGALDDVHVLRVPGNGLPAAAVRFHVHHGQSAGSDVRRLFHQLHHVRLPEGGRPAILSRVTAEHHPVVRHVFQLRGAVRPVLLQRVHQQSVQKENFVQTTLMTTTTTTTTNNVDPVGRWKEEEEGVRRRRQRQRRCCDVVEIYARRRRPIHSFFSTDFFFFFFKNAH